MICGQLLVFIAALLSLSHAARPDPADHEQLGQQSRSGQSLLAVGQKAEMQVVKGTPPSSFFQEALDRASVLFDEVAKTLTASKLEQVEDRISHLVRAQNEEGVSAHQNPCEVSVSGRMAPDTMLEKLALCINHLDRLAKTTHESAEQSHNANQEYVDRYLKADGHLTILEANELARKFKVDHVHAYCALHQKLCNIKADFRHINNMPPHHPESECLKIKECGSDGALPAMSTNSVTEPRPSKASIQSFNGPHGQVTVVNRALGGDADSSKHPESSVQPEPSKQQVDVTVDSYVDHHRTQIYGDDDEDSDAQVTGQRGGISGSDDDFESLRPSTLDSDVNIDSQSNVNIDSQSRGAASKVGDRQPSVASFQPSVNSQQIPSMPLSAQSQPTKRSIPGTAPQTGRQPTTEGNEDDEEYGDSQQPSVQTQSVDEGDDDEESNKDLPSVGGSKSKKTEKDPPY